MGCVFHSPSYFNYIIKMERLNQEDLAKILNTKMLLGRLHWDDIVEGLQSAWENGHEAAEANLDRLVELKALKIMEVGK